MKASTQPMAKVDELANLILNFPEELLTEDWQELQTYMPADLFLYGVMTWILADRQEPLADVLQVALEERDHVDGESVPVIAGERIEELVYKLATQFHTVFSDVLKSIIPENYGDSPVVESVIYDLENQDIYVIFDVEDDEVGKSTATNLIDHENEAEDADEGTDGEESDDDEDSNDSLDD